MPPEVELEEKSSFDNEAFYIDLVSREIFRCLGVIASRMRWGDDDRIAAAIEKLRAAARFLLHSEDRYSWILARLLVAVVEEFEASNLRRHISELQGDVDSVGQNVFERYLRQAYCRGRSLAWPSQVEGYRRLQLQGSFVLCTPTGSGKTSVAEVAILQALFQKAEGPVASDFADLGLQHPLVMYLVPSRALAAEVEAKLHDVLKDLVDERVNVTGLYGGIDWGPTDAWVTSDDRTVLICTYEKAEALLRFLGPLFLKRIGLVIFDEAHKVHFSDSPETVDWSAVRSLKLESLITRLIAYLQDAGRRIIALSAVARHMEQGLAHWVGGSPTATAVRVNYRSTRQLLGRLEISRSGEFTIRYSLMDSSPLQFATSGPSDGPYVPKPVPDVSVP